MKRQFAMLFALTFMVSGMATMAEQAAQPETQENEQILWEAPFADGAWLEVPEWNAEVYLPAGWTLSEVNETGFIAGDADETGMLTVTIEDFLTEEAGVEETTEEAAEETAEENTEEAAEETTEETAEETDGAELSAFEAHLIGLGQEYELALLGEREAATMTSEESLTVMFPLNDHLVTMVFTPAEGGAADSALSIAETFYIYPETVEMTEPIVITETTVASETAAE